ncbi:MAG: hypothetical protein AAF773_23325 [Cyanobacteria bacterium P01_D01_bin.115]
MQRKQANAIAVFNGLQDWDAFPDDLRPEHDKPQLPAHLIPGETYPPDFLQRHLPLMKIPRGQRHNNLWDWTAELQPEQSARSRVEIWPRGGAKSSEAEQICAYLACSLKRRLALYVCGTQDQADLHVQAIAAILEKMGVPRAVNAYSASINWTAQRLQTANGFGVIGVGLDSRIRGARLEEQRPDLIILDDVDETHDSARATQKKLATISKSILAASATYGTALFIQNKIHKDSAIAQVADGRAGILIGASVCEEPAVYDLEIESYFDEESGCNKFRVVDGRASWPEGQGLEVAEKQINDWGPPTFKTESQHEDAPEGGLWDKEADIDPCRITAEPKQLTRIVIGVDPPGGATEAGIVTVGRDNRSTPHFFILKDDSGAGTPNEWMSAAIARYWDMEADAIAVETNFGGDMVKAGIRNLDPRVAVIEVRASRGKLIRAEPVQLLYPEGRVHHVGTFLDLEREMCTWQPGMPSPNRLDALVWSITDLMNYKTTQFNFDTLVSTSSS